MVNQKIEKAKPFVHRLSCRCYRLNEDLVAIADIHKIAVEFGPDAATFWRGRPLKALRANSAIKQMNYENDFAEDVSSPIDVFAILQYHMQIFLFFIHCPSASPGMCVRTRGGDQLVAINSKLTHGRQRFTACA